MTPQENGKAELRTNGKLYWQPGRDLKPSEYAITRQAGFKWEGKRQAWAAKHTPEREAFLLQFVTSIERPAAFPFAGHHQRTPQ